MAGKIILEDGGYSDLKEKAKTAHEGMLDALEYAISQLESLNTGTGGFYVDNISGKVSAVLQEIRSVQPSMESAFDAQLTIIESFKTAIDNYDIEC